MKKTEKNYENILRKITKDGLREFQKFYLVSRFVLKEIANGGKII